MIPFIAKKIKNKKLLNICLLIGTILLAAFLCIYPMFREGSLNRLIKTLFLAQQEEEGEYPAVISLKETLSYEEFSSVAETSRRLKETGDKWCADLKADSVMEQQVFTYHGGSASSRFGPKSRVINLGYVTDLYRYADVVYGVGAEEADRSENEYVKEALENGAYPCVISQKTMDDNGFIVGELLSFKYRIYDDTQGMLDFVITGVIEEKEDAGLFWHMRLNDPEKTVYLRASDFDKIARENEIGEINVTENRMPDYSKIDHKNAQDYKSYLEKITKENTHISVNFLTTLTSYKEQEKEISMILFAFEIPIVALLLLFLYMVSGRILEMETTEIAMLKSRGITRGRIIAIYALQSSIIAGIGSLIGIPAGFLMCRLAAGTDGFLSFTLKDVSTYDFSLMMFPFAAGAFLLGVLFMTLPVIGLSKLTITDRKGLRVSLKHTPFWEKYFLDVLLLLISAYLLYNYYKQSTVMSETIIAGGGVDPVIFLDSSLFILSCGLVFLRLSGYLVRLIYRIGQKKWKPAGFVAFLQIIRGAKKQGFISVFLIMTIAMGVFNTNLARTVNENTKQRIEYNLGCDLRIDEVWRLITIRNGDEMNWSYREPDFGRYDVLKEYGASGMTRVLRDEKTDIIIGTKTEKGNILMGIHTKEFGTIAKLPADVNSRHWFHDLNALAKDPKGVIISSNLAEKYALKIGDKIKYARYGPMSDKEPYATVEGRVCGIVDAFPGYESTDYTVGESGGVEEKEKYLLVVNYATLISDFSQTPYSVWVSLDKDADPDKIREALKEKIPSIATMRFGSEEIQKNKDSAMLQITNGMFSVGFIVSLLICVVGFLIYWILTIRERELLYGIYRAMGMSMKEIVKMLITEQIFSSFLATLSGFGVGALTTVLFTKLLSIVYLPRKHNLPITIFFRLQDSIRMIAIIAAAFTVCFFIMRRLIRNMNITTALKMGED